MVPDLGSGITLVRIQHGRPNFEDLIMVNVDVLKENIAHLERQIKETKAEFSEYIKDKNIPLKERWKLFKKAPDYLKKHESWIMNFDAESLLEDGEIVWYDDCYVERYSTVDTTSMIEWFSESDRKKFTKDFIEALREEILQKNLGSFVNDW